MRLYFILFLFAFIASSQSTPLLGVVSGVGRAVGGVLRGVGGAVGAATGIVSEVVGGAGEAVGGLVGGVGGLVDRRYDDYDYDDPRDIQSLNQAADSLRQVAAQRQQAPNVRIEQGQNTNVAG